MESLTRLMKTAEECRSLFNEAGLEYPAPLKRILGMLENPHAARHQSVVIPPPASPGRPVNVPADWISVPMAAMTPSGIVLGVLRDAGRHLPVRQVVAAVEKLRTEVNAGSIANIGTRLEREHVIERTEAGWKLLDHTKAPTLNGSHAWGGLEAFAREELAASRREAILHVLKLSPAGLQPMQILGTLESCDWLRLPVTKDMVKLDMTELQKEKKVKRSSNGKWVPMGED